MSASKERSRYTIVNLFSHMAGRIRPFPDGRDATGNDRFSVWIQPVDATHALNRSAGVSKSRVFLGRSFSLRATALSFTCECTDTSVPLGKYCLNKPLVFSFVPRCQGFCGSQK